MASKKKLYIGIIFSLFCSYEKLKEDPLNVDKNNRRR